MDDSPNDVRLTDTQLGILAALCRPTSGGDRVATPATDEQIAAEASLGVGEVESHLRTLYVKFGIDDLPDDRKRARLVEVAIEGGYLPRTGVPLESLESRPRPVRAPAEPKSGHSTGEYVTVIVLVLVVLGGAVAISGVINSKPSTAPPAPTAAAFRTEVAGYCRQALEDAPPTAGQDRAELARGYLEVIEAVRGKFESLIQPTLPDVALERFSTGLANAANYTGDIAKGPPPAGSADEAKIVAELTRAAGQVQAGATGYRLGPECVEIGHLVAHSAQNAAAP